MGRPIRRRCRRNSMKGIFPALVTPLGADGKVNVGVVDDLIEHHLDVGVDGFYVCGYTGEGLLLERETRIQMARCVCNRVAGRGRVIVHVGATATEEARQLARAAADAGADAISSLPPMVYRLGFGAIADYYRVLARETDLPLYIYHIPNLTGISFSIDEFAQLFAIPRVVGIKFSDFNLFLLQQIRETFPEITVFNGNDEVFLPALLMGAHGSIGSTLNYMPAIYVGIYREWAAGRLEQARELQVRANRVIARILSYGTIQACKAILRMQGHDCGTVRDPLPPLTSADEDKLRRELDEIGFFSEQFATPAPTA